MNEVNIFWFRRDLRLHDNAGLYQALKSSNPVIPIFIFDKNILNKLDNKKDRRVTFIYQSVQKIHEKLKKYGSTVEVYYDYPDKTFVKLLAKYNITKVFANYDYEPYSIERDKKVCDILRSNNVEFITFKDHVIFDKNEVAKDNGNPYTVFTPYSKKWKEKLSDFYLQSYPSEKYSFSFYRQSPFQIPVLSSIGFEETADGFPTEVANDSILIKYSEERDYPSLKGTSKLGVHLRFGTISLRALVTKAQELNETYLNELIWRDFYQSILWHFPDIGNNRAFKKEYDNIEWRNNENEFDLWCQGKTGYPIVDAGMRQLNQTGFMHNRVRMIVASFLVKHLLIDWRWGEAYFAEKLLDYDFASNNGGWQWAAGSGCDAAPYFRIFNPYLQTKKFDPDLKYVSKWVPEFRDVTYPVPIVEHVFARNRSLEAYRKAVKAGK